MISVTEQSMLSRYILDVFIMGQFDHVLDETLTDHINRMITITEQSMLSRYILDVFIMGQFDHVLDETLTDHLNRMITITKESMLSRYILVLVHFGSIRSHYLKYKIYWDHIDWHPL